MELKRALFPLTLIAFIASSCSSGFKRPESIEDKMNRFQSRKAGVNLVPKAAINESLLLKRRFSGKRGPASSSIRAKEKESLPYNNKKLYFLTLLDQYQHLKSYSKKELNPSLKICPKFHSVLLYHNEQFSKNKLKQTRWPAKTYDYKRFDDNNYLAAHPELSLPITKNSTGPTVVDVLKKKKGSSVKEYHQKTIQQAFGLHLSKTFSELQELCEYGGSSNYYIYENIMTHAKKSRSLGKNSKNLTTLLKTTIFSNIALKKSLTPDMHSPKKLKAKHQGRKIASVQTMEKHGLEKEVINRLGAYWIEDYLNSLRN